MRTAENKIVEKNPSLETVWKFYASYKIAKKLTKKKGAK